MTNVTPEDVDPTDSQVLVACNSAIEVIGGLQHLRSFGVMYDPDSDGLRLSNSKHSDEPQVLTKLLSEALGSLQRAVDQGESALLTEDVLARLSEVNDDPASIGGEHSGCYCLAALNLGRKHLNLQMVGAACWAARQSLATEKLSEIMASNDLLDRYSVSPSGIRELHLDPILRVAKRMPDIDFVLAEQQIKKEFQRTCVKSLGPGVEQKDGDDEGHLSRPLTRAEAAKFHGGGAAANPSDYIKNRIRSGTLSAPIGSGRQLRYDTRQFPESVREQMK